MKYYMVDPLIYVDKSDSNQQRKISPRSQRVYNANIGHVNNSISSITLTSELIVETAIATHSKLVKLS